MTSKIKSCAREGARLLPEKLLRMVLGYSSYQNGWQKAWNIHPSAFIGRLSTINASGGLMVGSKSYVDSNSRLFSNDASFAFAQEKCTFGDIIIGNNVKVLSGVNLLPGMIIPDNTVVSSESELSKYLNRETNFNSILTNTKSAQPIFILSTGRSGSTSFARAFNELDGYQGKHESIKALTLLGYLKAHNANLYRKYKSSAINRLKFSAHCVGEKTWVESDQRLYNFIPELLECFPHARFIHCKREEPGFVRSAALRGWYKPNEIHHIWERFRPHPTREDKTINGWDDLIQEEKLSWYYHHLNNEIHNKLSSLVKPKNWTMIHLEESSKEEKISQFVDEQIRLPKMN